MENETYMKRLKDRLQIELKKQDRSGVLCNEMYERSFVRRYHKKYAQEFKGRGF